VLTGIVCYLYRGRGKEWESKFFLGDGGKKKVKFLPQGRQNRRIQTFCDREKKGFPQPFPPPPVKEKKKRSQGLPQQKKRESPKPGKRKQKRRKEGPAPEAGKNAPRPCTSPLAEEGQRKGGRSPMEKEKKTRQTGGRCVFD